MKRIFTALAVTAVMGFVTACQKENLNVEATGIKMSTSLILDVNQTFQLTASIVPNGVTHGRELAWSSSNPDVAKVDSEGNITAISVGSTTITATIKSRPSISAACNVTVDEETVVFEDNKFMALMMYFDKNNDGKIQLSEAAEVTDLNITGNGITSLKGIEYFVNLEKLNCSRNSLSWLDVSHNLKLKELLCFSNKLEALDVSMLQDLEVLDCNANRLSAIDVTHNLELVNLNCGMNSGGMSAHDGIREIDVTNNTKLEVLDVYYTNLSELDVTNNKKLKYLNIGHSCHTRWDLTPIEEIDLSHNPDLEYFNCMSSNVRKSDIEFGFDFDFGMNKVDVTHNTKLKYLITYGNPKVKEIDLSNNPQLKYLNVSWNDLTRLDISKCPLIDTMSCHWNKLTELDLTASKELIYLDCANNQIGRLDFSNTKLGYLLANDNKITEIDMGDKTFNTIHKPSAGSGTTSVDNQPYLYMKLNNNLIEEIDLSKQTYLHWLEISDNKLTKLDVSGCIKLGGLHCANNQLTELLIEGCTRMWELRCENNQLSGVFDISGFPGSTGKGFTRMSIENNNLTAIKVPAGFDPDSKYFFEGKSLPCYSKDDDTEWLGL